MVLVYIVVCIVAVLVVLSFFSMGLLTRLETEKLGWEHRVVMCLAVLTAGAQGVLLVVFGKLALLCPAIIMGSWLAGMLVGLVPSLRRAYKAIRDRAEKKADQPDDDEKS